MRVAISTDGDFVSEHFGRCPKFTIVDIESNQVVNKEEIDNPGHVPGLIPEYLSEKGVNCIVAGGMGARAQQFFNQFGIKTFMGVSGTVDEAIDKLKKDDLESGESLCNPGSGKGYGVEKNACDHEGDHGAGDTREKCKTVTKSMKVCVTSEGDTQESKLDPRFGRCKYFIIVDTGTMEFEVIENSNAEASGGVGIQSGNLMAEKNVEAVLTGDVGPNAFETLNAAGIKVYTKLSGNIIDVVEKFKEGGLTEEKSASVTSHSGMKKN